jgi:hypothetical protein
VHDPGITCDDPNTQAADGSHYDATIDLAPTAQAVGTYSLQDIETNAWDCTISIPFGCSGTNGSTCTGTVEITSIDASQVVFTLALGTCYWGYASPPMLDGTYTAPRCD